MASYEKLSSGKKTYKEDFIQDIFAYKIHGSLNSFKTENDIIEINSLMYMNELPKEVERFMVTPGTAKYEKLLTGKSLYWKGFQIKGIGTVFSCLSDLG